ncbi:hypothetical protein ACLFKQ_02380, partial [Myxosarcina sp. GI1(2024)]
MELESYRSRSPKHLIKVQVKQSESNHNYKCCFCRHFQLEGHRWGHCEILNVEVKGNCPACSIA